VNTFYAGVLRVRRQLRVILLQGVVAGGVAMTLVWPFSRIMGLVGLGVAFVLAQAVSVLVLTSMWLLTVSRRAHTGAGG
jgi:hypothetical protein